MLRSGLCSTARAQRLARRAGPSPLLVRDAAAAFSSLAGNQRASQRAAMSAPARPQALSVASVSPLYRDAYVAFAPIHRVPARGWSSVPTSTPPSAPPSAPPTAAESAAMKKKIAAARRRRSKIQAQVRLTRESLHLWTHVV